MNNPLRLARSCVAKSQAWLAHILMVAIVSAITFILAIPRISYRWLKKSTMKNWQAVVITIVVSALVVLSTNLWIFFTGFWQQSRYEDSVLRASAISQLKTKNNRVTIFKAWSENLHGLDHKTMIVAADVETTEKNGFTTYTGVLTLYDKPKADYTFRFILNPEKGWAVTHPTWAGIDAYDLDGDCTKELILRWYGKGMNSWDRQYVGIVGWDGSYKYFGTLPTYDCPEANKTVTAGGSIKISWKSSGGKTRTGLMRACTYLKEKDVFGDGTQDILCADSIWRIAEGENHTDDHNYIMTVLYLRTDNHHQKKLYADWRWNLGQPMYLPGKYPATFFLFTPQVMGLGLKGFQHQIR